MKTNILMGALTLWSSVGFAQTTRPVNYVAPDNLQVKLNDFFSAINTSQISSGLLMDKSPGVLDPLLYNGSSGSPNASVNDWYAAFQQVKGARLNGSWNLPTQQTLFDKVDFLKSEDRIPLGILFADYHQIKDGSTASEGWFTINNNKLIDMPGRMQNPYEQKNLAMIAPFRSGYEDGNVTFVIPSDLVVTNKGSFSIEIDYDDGRGFLATSLNAPVAISYPTEGIKNIVCKLSQSGTVYYARTTFTIKNVYTHNNTFRKNCTGICFDALWSDVDHQTGIPVTSSEAYIIYANGRSYLQRPFVFVEGQDLDEEYNFKELYYALSNDLPNSSGSPLNQLISNGYDVIILNFKNRAKESMRSNGEVLRRLLNWVNQNKQGDGKITLSGVSMGGVIARYTLTKMESVYCEEHNVEKYLSLDAPHTGANVPLGLQILTRNAYALSFGFSYDMARNYSQVTATSTMELLSAHVWGNGGRTPNGVSFYNELKQLGMPQKCRNVAWGNGNTFNNIPAPTDMSVAFNQGEEILGYIRLPNPNANKKLTLVLRVNAVNSAVPASVLDLKVKYEVHIDYPWYIPLPDVDWTAIDLDDRYILKTDKPYDNAPGGYVFTQQNVAEGLPGSTTHGRNHHCIVPTMSAYGIETTALFYNQTYENIDVSRVSPFDAVYASSNSVNYCHKVLPPNLAVQLVGEILTPPVLRNSLMKLQNQTYNISSSSSVQQIPNININKGGVLLINGETGSEFGSGIVPQSGSSIVVNSSECASTVHIRDGGIMRLGDGKRFATVNIKPGSSVIIHKDGRLDVRYGSKLVLAGGSLIFEQGAVVNLQDLESVLEIQDGGKILIDANAVFSWTGSGFMRVNTTTKGVSNVLAVVSGNNAKFEQRGNVTKKVIEVTNGSLSVDRNLSGFTVISGKVLMGEHTMFDVASPMYLANIRMDVLTPGTRYSGIWVYGQQNTSYLNSCAIDNADIGLRIFGNKGLSNKALVYNTNFNNCDIGILAYGKSVEVDGGKFWGNKTGIFLSGAQFSSKVSNIEARNNRSAIDVVGSGSDVLNMKFVDIYNNSAVGAFIVNSKVLPTCSKIYNNYPSANPTTGSNVLLREFAVMDIEPLGPKDGGRNMLSNAASSSLMCVGAKGFMLNKGLTDFTTPTSALSISGTLDKWPGSAPRPVVLATENFWGTPLAAPFNGIDYSVQYQTPIGVTTLTIDGSNALGSSSTLQSCNVTVSGGGSVDERQLGNSSLFYGKTDLYLSNGSSMKQQLLLGLEKLHGTAPDYTLALGAFLGIVKHPFSTAAYITLPSGSKISQFEQWYDVIDYSYTKALEAAGYIAGQGTIDQNMLPSLVSVISLLRTKLAVVGNAEDRLFELNLDEALLYRLVNQRREALAKINSLLAQVQYSETHLKLLQYYQCLISNELYIETSDDKEGYLAIDACRSILGMDAGGLERVGERPADPVYREQLSKRGGAVSSEVDEGHAEYENRVSPTTILLYPNPAQGRVTIQLPATMKADAIHIVDLAGKVVVSTNCVGNEGGVVTLPLSLQNGLYVVEAIQGNQVLARQKLMVTTE